MRKNILAVLIMLLATLLTACGSQAAAPSTEAETTKVETAKAEETEPAALAEVEEVVEAEPTAESTPEPVVYEGIDMESTLPGLEWIETFDGIIDEPKFVIFNDETNKKIIVENNQEIEFLDTDKLVSYAPKGKELYIKEGIKFGIFEVKEGQKNVNIYSGLFPNIQDGDKITIKEVDEMEGDDYVLTATLIINLID